MPTDDSWGDLSPQEELAEIVRSLRAHLEWQGVLGTTALPRDPEAKQKVAALYAAAPPVTSGSSSRTETPRAEVRTPPAERQPERQEPEPDFSRDVANIPSAPAERVAPAPKAPVAPKKLPLLTTDLVELEKLVAACTACALHATRTQTVFARGTGASGLMFVGEGPGEEEDRQGAPFVGPAGQLLDRMIDAMGFSREEVYVANIVKCRPPGNRKPEPGEMAACKGFLEAQIAAKKPEYIVALGATALTGLFGPNEGITKARGRFRTLGGDTLVMPTFHPSYLLRVPSAKKDTWADLLQVVRAMGRTPKGK